MHICHSTLYFSDIPRFSSSHRVHVCAYDNVTAMPVAGFSILWQTIFFILIYWQLISFHFSFVQTIGIFSPHYPVFMTLFVQSHKSFKINFNDSGVSFHVHNFFFEWRLSRMSPNCDMRSFSVCYLTAFCGYFASVFEFVVWFLKQFSLSHLISLIEFMVWMSQIIDESVIRNENSSRFK